MLKKYRINTYLLSIFVIILIILVPLTGVLAGSIGDFKHYEDKAKKWSNAQINHIKSGYQEDEVLPHFVQFTDLTPGDTYAFYIFMDYFFLSSNSCGHDYVAQYDTTTRLIPILETGITPTAAPVQDASFELAGVGEGFLWSYGNDTTSTHMEWGADSGGGGDVQRNVLIQFEPTETTVEFWWGEHIAIPFACDGHTDSQGNTIADSSGASDWAGGGLRTKIADQDGLGNFPTGATTLPTSGAIQLMTSGIRPPTFEGQKWFDTNGNQVWDDGEPPLKDWLIYLEKCTSADPITCTDAVPPVTYVTDINGYYAIYVPLDENFDVVEGYYRVCEDLDAQNPKWEATYPYMSKSDDVCHPIEYIDAIPDNFSGLNFGNYLGPTAVTLAGFTARPQNINIAVLVEWQTILQTDTLGFNLYRSLYENGTGMELLAYIPVKIPEGGVAEYDYLDDEVLPGKTYYYWLEVVAEDTNDPSQIIATAAATWWWNSYIPMITR